MGNAAFTFRDKSYVGARVPGVLAVVGWAAGWAALATGCSDHKDFGLPSDAMAAEMAQTICAKAYECCTTAQLMSNQAAGADRATCETMTTQNFKNLLASISASQSKGRAKYDGTKVSNCLARVRSAMCSELQTTNHLSGVRDCDSFATPEVAAGGACTADWECVGGWCDTSGATAGGDGVCRAFAGAGQSCASDRCASNALCSGGTSTCVALGADGATCGASAPCASGSCTLSAGSDTGTCAAHAADSCFYASGCALGPGRPTMISMGISTLIAAVMLTRMARRKKRTS